MDIKNFLNTVKEQIKYEPVRKNIEEELKSHIEDAKEDFIIKGLSDKEAEEKAVEAMGNPEDIGKKLNKVHRPKFDWKLGLLVLILLGFGIFIAILQNDTSNLIIVSLKIIKESKQKVKSFIKLGMPFLLLGLVFTFFVIYNPYRIERIISSFNPELDPMGSGYVGMLQKEILKEAKWVGEADTDVIKSDEFVVTKDSNFTFIYLVGKSGILVGGILVLTIVLLFGKLILNAKNIKDMYGKFLIVGMGSLYIVQSVMSVLMNVNLVVKTSINLPLVSYGAVYFIVNMFCIGLVFSVYKRKDVIEYEEE